MDIGGHPSIPLAQNNCPLRKFPSYFSTVFRVLKFCGHFEALNDIVGDSRGQIVSFNMDLVPSKISKDWIDISNGLSSTQIRDRMQNL